jgi:hypothetical protein
LKNAYSWQYFLNHWLENWWAESQGVASHVNGNEKSSNSMANGQLGNKSRINEIKLMDQDYQLLQNFMQLQASAYKNYAIICKPFHIVELSVL